MSERIFLFSNAIIMLIFRVRFQENWLIVSFFARYPVHDESYGKHGQDMKAALFLCNPELSINATQAEINQPIVSRRLKKARLLMFVGWIRYDWSNSHIRCSSHTLTRTPTTMDCSRPTDLLTSYAASITFDFFISFHFSALFSSMILLIRYNHRWWEPVLVEFRCLLIFLKTVPYMWMQNSTMVYLGGDRLERSSRHKTNSSKLGK